MFHSKGICTRPKAFMSEFRTNQIEQIPTECSCSSFSCSWPIKIKEKLRWSDEEESHFLGFTKRKENKKKSIKNEEKEKKK